MTEFTMSLVVNAKAGISNIYVPSHVLDLLGSPRYPTLGIKDESCQSGPAENKSPTGPMDLAYIWHSINWNKSRVLETYPSS